MKLTQRIARTSVAVVLSGSIVAAGSTSAFAAGEQDGEWSRVQQLAPGTSIAVTVHGLPPRERQVVSVSESGLMMLNTADSTLPSDVQQTLRAVAVSHPEYLWRAPLGNTTILQKSISLQRDGVFLDGRKLASLSDILETTARRDVGEIATRHRGRGVWGRLGPLGGFFVGGLGGGMALGLVCRAARGTNRCDTGAFLAGMMIGGVAGGTYGFHAARRETEVVVYRADRVGLE
jgi:hypothetical protein